MTTDATGLEARPGGVEAPGDTADTSDPERPPDTVESVAAAAALGPFLEAADEVDRESVGALEAALRSGLEKHAEAIAEAGLEREMPDDPDERVERLNAYRHTVSAELLDPLTTMFAGRPPASSLVTETIRGLEAAVAATDALPETVTEPWPEGALARREDDGRIRVVAKALARVFSSARKAGRPRELPLRAVAQHHLRDVVVPGEDAAVAAGALEWARWSRDLERAWKEWADRALVALLTAGRGASEDATGAWLAVREAANELQERLQTLTGNTPDVTGREAVRARLSAARSRLEGDLAVAGSFVYEPTETGQGDWSLRGLERMRPALDRLDEGVASRLTLYSTLLGVLTGAAAVRERMLARFREECMEGIRGLLPAADRLEALRAEVPSSPTARGLREALPAFRERITSTAAPVLAEVPEADFVAEILEGGTRGVVEALTSIVRRSPETLALTPLDVEVQPRMRRVEVRPVPMRQLARQSFDVLRLERIRQSGDDLLESVKRLLDNVAELENVFAFAFDSADSELDSDDPEAIERARDLVADSLENIADTLRKEVAAVEAAELAASQRLATEIGDGARGLVERVTAGGVQAQMLAAQSRVADLRARLGEYLGPRLTRWSRALRYRFLLVWRRVRRVWARVVRAVAGASGEETASTRVVRVLADASAVIRDLPPVYQRLFSLEPVTERTLLVGRDAEIAEGVARWRRLESGSSVPLVVRAVPGSGASSYLRALCATVEDEGGRALYVPLGRRIRNEQACAQLLAEALGLETCDTLSELRILIEEAPEDALPQLVTIDELEQMYLRVPGGTDLIERFLTFMVETETRILWMSSITPFAWQLVKVTEPTSVAQVEEFPLERMSADSIRAAIMVRHRRSGLPLRFQEPRNRPLVQRKLRKARTPEAEREILEEDFFEQLARTSSGHLRLALFQWLQCVDFEQDEGVVVHSPSRPDFSVLDTLSLTQDFTLKAFVEHGTLTLGEHDDIFRLPRSVSYQIFESLVNRHLIAPVRAARAADGRNRAGEAKSTKRHGLTDYEGSRDADQDERFRLHPLLVGAVVSHLRSGNIVH